MQSILILFLAILSTMTLTYLVPQEVLSLKRYHGCADEPPYRCGEHIVANLTNTTSSGRVVSFPTGQELFGYLEDEGVKEKFDSLTNSSLGEPSNVQTAIARNAPGNNTWVAWQGNIEGINRVFITESADGRKNFSSPFQLSPSVAGNASNLQLGVSDSGESVYVAWQDTNITDSKTRVFLSSSMDGGKQFRTYPLNAGDVNATDPRMTVFGEDVFLNWIQKGKPLNGTISEDCELCSHGARW
jgi:hypothetical protein